MSRLKVVVLPEPLGPMSPEIAPRATAKLQPSTARTPPKAFRRSRASRTVSPGAEAHQWTIPLRTQPRSTAKPMRPRGMKRAMTTMKSPYAIRWAVGKLTQVSSCAV